ncbi:MAG: efflux RND transporter periplasmic adaptor subunit [Betaproteobacteria bacterium]
MRFHKLVLLLPLAFSGCGDPAVTAKPQPPVVSGERIVFTQDSPQLAAFALEKATVRETETVRLNGRIVWDEERTVRIYAPFAGRVERIFAQPGEKIAQGQVLATLSSPDFGQAQAEARKAASDYALASQNFARVKDLHDHGVTARKDLNAAEADIARADAELKRATERLRMYGGHPEAIDQRFPVKSPIAGLLVERNINPGQELRPDQMSGASAQFVVTDPLRLWVQLDVPERDLAGIRAGQTMAISAPAYPGEAFSGTVTNVSDFIDPTTRMARVRGKVDNAARKLKGEMFINAEITMPGKPEVQISSKAVFSKGGVNYVFVQESAGSFARRVVTTGREKGGNVVVLSGLGANEQVVAQGALLLQQVLQDVRSGTAGKES